jgi:hypothetical protein
MTRLLSIGNQLFLFKLYIIIAFNLCKLKLSKEMLLEISHFKAKHKVKTFEIKREIKQEKLVL